MVMRAEGEEPTERGRKDETKTSWLLPKEMKKAAIAKNEGFFSFSVLFRSFRR
jgi:hypothetical protein